MAIFDEIPEMEDELIELTGDMSQRNIANHLSAKYDTDVTKSMVYKRQVKLKLNRQGRPKTTDELVAEKKKHFQEEMSKNELEQLFLEKTKTEMVIDAIKESIIPIPAPKINTAKMKAVTTDEEVAVLDLSDLHAGKVTKSYNSEVFVKRLETLKNNVALIVNILRKSYPIRKLVILCKGDIVDNHAIYKTHAWHIDQHVMNQIFSLCVPALTDFISAMSGHFEQVEVVCVPGNHGRAGKFQPEELNFDTILYEVLKLATQNLHNVRWEITWDWYIIKEIMGWKFLVTHGSQIKMWLNIPIYGETQKGMRWQGSMKTSKTEIQSELTKIIKDSSISDKEKIKNIMVATSDWDYLSLAHFHFPHRIRWTNFEILCNGTFVTDDDFSLRDLGFNSEAKQILQGVHPKRGLTWYYKVDLEN